MKTNLIPFIAATLSLALSSCGYSRMPVAGAGDYQYQQYLAQQRALENGRPSAPSPAEPVEAQQYSKRPKAVLREENPTMALAFEKSDHLRSFGQATGFVESSVMDHAIIVAQERMSVLLRSSIESAASNYTRNANVNLDNTGATLFESVAKRFSINISKNARIIKHSVYDLDNGQVTIYVCIESQQTDNALSKQLANELSREGFLGLQFDRDRFAAQSMEGLNEYRKSLSKEAETSE